MRNKYTLYIGILFFFYLFSCKDKNINNYPIPDVPVNLTFNLSLPLYSHLELPGSFIYTDGGYKGIIILHNFDGEFIAFDRACTHNTEDICSKITLDSNFFQLRCGNYFADSFAVCCGSKFNTNGLTINGPATLPLKRYTALRDGSFLVVRN